MESMSLDVEFLVANVKVFFYPILEFIYLFIFFWTILTDFRPRLIYLFFSILTDINKD